MINEEIQKFESLTGNNANDFSLSYVGGYLDGYEKGKSEYTSPVLDPSFITDLSAVKDWQICGYRVEDLIKLSLILRDKNISDYNLRDHNEAFALGYQQAGKELDKALKDQVHKLFDEFKSEFKEAADNDNE